MDYETMITMVIPIFLFVFATMFVFVLYRIIKGFRGFADIKAKNIDWYKRNHPGAIIDGQISCVGCGSRQHHIQPMVQVPMVREHLCKDCGKVLFYSEESRLV